MATAKAWMPFYVGDYLKDTMHLTTEQHGAYLLLLMAAWQNGGAVDEAKAAAVARLPAAKWKASRDTLAGLFVVADGVWTHKRVVAELAIAAKKSQQAKESAGLRWASETHSEDDAGADANAYANADANAMRMDMPSVCSSPSPSPSKEVTEVSKSKLPPQKRPGRKENPAEAAYFARGYEILGKGKGGLIARVLQRHGGNYAQATATLESAVGRANPVDFIGGILKPRAAPDAFEAGQETTSF